MDQRKKGFLDYFMPKYRYLQIEVPYYEYLRGEVFLEDTKDLFEEAPQNLTLYHLIALLYFDFLEQVKKGAKYEQLCPFLISSWNGR
ncbi:hypothetical protein [Peribacillus frigoritolerans]|uniref:hypothetical protein n=1 Tax=Peribacillus frigoritolerans TaxID=450367 RepID=UPI002EC10AE8|nr:hypothetical protein [Peribacillus frigoritolerans]